MTARESVYAQVKKALADAADDALDISRWAHEFTPSLSRAERDALAERGVAEIARGIRLEQRRPDRRAIDRHAGASKGKARKLRVVGAGNERAKQGSELDLAYFSVWTGERHVWLLECTAADLTGAIGEHDRLAQRHRLSAEQLGQVRSLLESTRRATVVGDLPRPRLLSIFDGSSIEDDARGQAAA